MYLMCSFHVLGGGKLQDPLLRVVHCGDAVWSIGMYVLFVLQVVGSFFVFCFSEGRVVLYYCYYNGLFCFCVISPFFFASLFFICIF